VKFGAVTPKWCQKGLKSLVHRTLKRRGGTARAELREKHAAEDVDLNVARINNSVLYDQRVSYSIYIWRSEGGTRSGRIASVAQYQNKRRTQKLSHTHVEDNVQEVEASVAIYRCVPLPDGDNWFDLESPRLDPARTYSGGTIAT
jgi:hypothetical protein